MVKILFRARGFSLFYTVNLLGKLLERPVLLNCGQINPFTKGNTYWPDFFFKGFLILDSIFTTSKNLVYDKSNIG